MFSRPLLLLALLGLAGAHLIYDETLWTKSEEWGQYRLEPGIWERLNPADDAIQEPELRATLQKSSWNSLDGPLPRRTVTSPLCVHIAGGRRARRRCTPGTAALSGPRCSCLLPSAQSRRPSSRSHLCCSVGSSGAATARFTLAHTCPPLNLRAQGPVGRRRGRRGRRQ
jgi:hypothetical protein